MQTVRVYSKNDIFQRLCALKENREKRSKYKQFLVEGVIVINQMLAQSWPVAAMLVGRGRRLSGWAKDAIARAKAEQLIELSPKLLQELSDKEETSELLAVARIPADNLSRIEFKTGLVVVFDRPTSPGNLGSSLRSCDAFGVDGVIVTGHAADMYHPQAVRGSMGSLFTVPVVRLPSHTHVAEWAATERKANPSLAIVGTSAEGGAAAINDFRFPLPTVLVLGNETFGLSAAYRETCDAVVRITMSGQVDSLNVSCATSILLYEIMRQRGFSGNV